MTNAVPAERGPWAMPVMPPAPSTPLSASVSNQSSSSSATDMGSTRSSSIMSALPMPRTRRPRPSSVIRSAARVLVSWGAGAPYRCWRKPASLWVSAVNASHRPASATEKCRSASAAARGARGSTSAPSPSGLITAGSGPAGAPAGTPMPSSSAIAGSSHPAWWNAASTRNPGWNSATWLLPPMVLRRSSTSTRWPAFARYAAATSPFCPAPITMAPCRALT